MIPGIMPVITGGKGPIALEFHGYHDIPYATSVTVSNVAIGDPSPDRLVLLVTHMVRGSSIGLASGSVEGVPIVKIVDLAASNSHLGISDALVPSGTIATVQLTPTANPGRNILMGVYSLRNYQSSTPVIGTTSSGSNSVRSSTVDVPPKGVALVAATKLLSMSVTWTSSLTQDYFATGASDTDPHSTLSGNFPDGGTASGSINCRAIASLAYA